MKKFLIFSLFASLMLAACSDSYSDAEDSGEDSGTYHPGPKYKCEGSVISAYYEPDTIRSSFFSPSQDSMPIPVGFGITSLSNLVYGECREESWYRGTSKARQYAAFYGDTTYFESLYIDKRYQVSAMPLKSICITADRDFDAEHPAGSQLNDLFLLVYGSAYNLIKSGYDPDLNMCVRSYAYQYMPLSELESLSLLQYGMSLLFTKLPDTIGEYTFTIAFEYGADPVSGKDANKIAPAVVKAVFTEDDSILLPEGDYATFIDDIFQSLPH